MGTLAFSKDSQRAGLYVPLGQTKKNPSLVIPFYKMERNELDDIVRMELAKQGITEESKVQAVIDEAETQYEERRKVEEARQELKRLMELKRQGATLMSVGNKKWRQAFYPAIKKEGGRG